MITEHRFAQHCRLLASPNSRDRRYLILASRADQLTIRSDRLTSWICLSNWVRRSASRDTLAHRPFTRASGVGFGAWIGGYWNNQQLLLSAAHGFRDRKIPLDVIAKIPFFGSDATNVIFAGIPTGSDPAAMTRSA